MTVTESSTLRSTHTVHAILVTHNGARWLPEVRRALEALNRRPDALIVVDTGSQDRSRELVTGLASTIVVAEEDDGFGDAVALAVEQLPKPSEGTVEWLWLLHDDFAPMPECLDALLASVDDAPSVGIAGPKIRGWHDRAHLLEVGVSIAGNGVRWTGLDRRERDQGQHDGNRDVLAVSTAGMLIRRDVWQELEGLDPNLSLFRDDVDLGWRANVAGHRVVCVSDAVAFHAEASANERRRIDVQGALHRPHLLDRRHAAYVLLANCSSSRLPIVFFRLIFSSALRALGYLFAKLPGYAADEVAGLALLIARPDLLRKARRARRQRRLLPARAVRPFLAPFGTQTRSAVERLRMLILRGIEPFITPTTTVTLPVDDEEEDIAEEPLIRRVVARPGVALALTLLVLSLAASRQRLGAITGGALLPAPTGASDLLAFYTESWHPIGLGSSAPSPAWTFLLAVGSILTAGNVPLLITALFVLAVPVSGIVMYAVLRPRVERHLVAAIGAGVYALSPVLLAAINGGRVGTVVTALLLPIFIRLVEPTLSLSGLLAVGWRRIWAITALLGVLIAFTPMLFPLVLVALAAWLVRHYREHAANLRVLTAVIGAFLLNMPWSASALLRPTRWLIEPGLAHGGATPASLLSLNPGGIGAPPLLMSGALIVLAIILIRVTRIWSSSWLLTVSGLVAVITAMLIATRTFTQHQSGIEIRPWLGSFLVLATAVFLFVAVDHSENVLASLRTSNASWMHALVALVAIVTTVSVVALGSWFALASGSALRTDRETVLPAFVAELSSTPDQARTLVLDASESQVKFSLLRGRELLLGEPDVAATVPKEFTTSVGNLLAGANQATVDQLGRYGIGFILMNEPVDQDLARTLDGVGGLTRLSVTDGRILWSVTTVTARVRLVDAAGTITPLRDDTGSLTFGARTPGIIALAERSDGSWRAVSQGRLLEVVDRGDGLQAFALPDAGEVTISHDDSGNRAGLTVAFLTAAILFYLITPSGRRLRERSDEEVA
jgi:GT2 family glycosyltransferase